MLLAFLVDDLPKSEEMKIPPASTLSLILALAIAGCGKPTPAKNDVEHAIGNQLPP
jgi:hypothetical protein